MYLEDLWLCLPLSPAPSLIEKKNSPHPPLPTSLSRSSRSRDNEGQSIITSFLSCVLNTDKQCPLWKTALRSQVVNLEAGEQFQ